MVDRLPCRSGTDGNTLPAMTRNVTLNLDAFGEQALERLGASGRGLPTGVVRTAALYYLGDRDARRPAWRVPRIRSRPAGTPGLEVEFDDETWSLLEAEADRQGVRPEELAVHALLYFLADFDSGRLAGLLEEALRRED